jgi:hypothetical protein
MVATTRRGTLRRSYAAQVRQVDLNLSANLSLWPDGKHVADDRHPDHQHRVDLKAKLVKQLPLTLVAPPHHRPFPSRIAPRKRNHASTPDFNRRPQHYRPIADILPGGRMALRCLQQAPCQFVLPGDAHIVPGPCDTAVHFECAPQGKGK